MWKRGILVGVIGLLILFVTQFGIYLGQTIDIANPIPFQQEEFDKMSDWALAHKQPNSAVLSLPSNYQNLSINGKVYFTNDYVFVPSLIGRTTLLPNPQYALWHQDDYGCEGYLYSKKNVVCLEPGGDIPQVKLNVPEPISDNQIGYRMDYMYIPMEGKESKTWWDVYSPAYDID